MPLIEWMCKVKAVAAMLMVFPEVTMLMVLPLEVRTMLMLLPLEVRTSVGQV